MNIKFKKLHREAKAPERQKLGDAGFDLTATTYEYKNARHIYGTGIAVEIPEGYVGLVFPRSSICKKDLRLSNAVGVIDSNYRGEIKAFFENEGMTRPDANFSQWLNNDCRIYDVGERIAQMIILPYPEVTYVEAEELSETNRGDKGFGSSN